MSSWQLKTYFFFIICLIFFGSCADNNEQFSTKDSIVIGVSTYPQNLDPRVATDALSHKINQLIYRGLFKFDDKLNLVPDLVKSYQWINSKDLKISLKSDLYFHDQSQLTTHDVKSTFESILDPKLISIHRQNFSKIFSIKIIDDQNMIIQLKEIYSPFLTSLNMGILPEEIIKSEFKPIGSGEFKFKSKIENEKLILERVHLDSQYINHIIFRTIFDDTLRTLELIKGRLDLVQNSIPPLLIPAIEKENLQLKSIPGINFSYLGFNLKHPLLSKVEVRRAIGLGINRDQIIKYKLKNLGMKASSLLSPEHWGFSKKLSQLNFDPEKAKKILDQIGLKDPDGDGPQFRFKLIYKTSTKKDRVDMALLIKEQLKKIGVEVEVKSYEWGTFYRDIRTGQFEMYSLTWVGITEPDIYYYAFHSDMIPPQGANRGYYQNPKLDSLLEKGRQVHDLSQRKSVYREVQSIIDQDQVYVPLWYDKNYVILSSDIQGYELRPDAGYQGLEKIIKVD